MLRRLRLGSSRTLTAALVVALLFAAGSVYYASGNGPGSVYYACITAGGALHRIEVDPAVAPVCHGDQTLISWNQQGPPGPAGPAGQFSGTFTSPNGLYSLSVTDAGIVMQGPAAKVQIDGSTVTVQGTNVNINGVSVAVNANAQLNLNGGITRVSGTPLLLNCAPGAVGVPLARITDTIQTNLATGIGTFITPGSSVLAC